MARVFYRRPRSFPAPPATSARGLGPTTWHHLAREYAEALASGDMGALRKLLRRDGAFAARTRRDLSRAVEAAFRPASVPTIHVR